MSIIPIFIPHAGCPHQCVFCNQRTISGQSSAAYESAEQQLHKWLAIIKPHRENELAFYGGSFTGLEHALQEKLLHMSDELVEQGIINGVRLSTRPDYLSDAQLRFLNEHHVKLIELGVQSLDDKVLALAGRGHSAGCVFDAVKMLRMHNMTVGVQLMVGMQGQDDASVKETARLVAEMRPDVARIYPLLVLRGTPLETRYMSGEFTPLNLDIAVEQSAYLYRKLTRHGVRVIRIGLQPDEELCSPGNIIAGPFHPAMGELVKSRVARQIVTAKLEHINLLGHKKAVISCSDRDESKLRGQRNCNVKYWNKRFPNMRISIIRETPSEVNTVVAEAENVIKYSDEVLILKERLNFNHNKI